MCNHCGRVGFIVLPGGWNGRGTLEEEMGWDMGTGFRVGGVRQWWRGWEWSYARESGTTRDAHCPSEA